MSLSLRNGSVISWQALTGGAGLVIHRRPIGISLRGFASEAMSFLAASPDLTAEKAHRILRHLNAAPRPRSLADHEISNRYTGLAGVFSLHEIGVSAIDWNEALDIVNHAAKRTNRYRGGTMRNFDFAPIR